MSTVTGRSSDANYDLWVELSNSDNDEFKQSHSDNERLAEPFQELEEGVAPQQENSEPSCFARHKCKLIGAATFGIIGLIGAILAVAYLYIPGAKQAIEGAIKEQPGAAALVTLGMGSAFGVMAFIIAKKGVDSKTAESQVEQGLQAAGAVQQRNHPDLVKSLHEMQQSNPPDPIESLHKRAEAFYAKLQTFRQNSGYKRSPLEVILMDSGVLYLTAKNNSFPDFLKEKAEAVKEAIKPLKVIRFAHNRYRPPTELETSMQKVDDLERILKQTFRYEDTVAQQERLEEKLATARAKVQEIKAPLEQALTENLNALLTEIANAINAEKDDRNKQQLAKVKEDLGRVIAYRDNYRELEEERETLREERFRLLLTNCANRDRLETIDDLLHSR